MNSGGSAYVGGTNSGARSINGGSGSLNVIGTNNGALSLSSGGSAYVGNGNTAAITVNGSTTLGINGDTSGSTLSLNGSNKGTITLNGGTLDYWRSSAGNVINVNGGKVHQGSVGLTAPVSTLGSFTTTFLTPLTALSKQLTAVAANSTTTSSNNAVTFNAAPSSSGVTVFDVNSRYLPRRLP